MLRPLRTACTLNGSKVYYPNKDLKPLEDFYRENVIKEPYKGRLCRVQAAKHNRESIHHKSHTHTLTHTHTLEFCP